ncbi:MAG: hypothetical protein HY741_04125 [Chloroflexi bacterium]|nr:hypothetical protein [Chloroflexota bacterium]
MINQRQIETNPYLKARGESQLRAKHAFERAAGWRFGLVFGVLIVLIGYVWDAIQLAQTHAEYWWIHLALACVTILPLAILAGAVSGYVNWLLKMAVWAVFGIAAGWTAIHIPFEGARLALQWFDANLRLAEYLPIPNAAASSFGMLATLGALMGLLVGLTQMVAVGWAWERTTEDFQLTPGGWAMFLAALPFALGYGLLFEGSAQTPLRVPMQTVQAIIESGLHDPPGVDQSNTEIHRALVYLVGQRWRKSMTPEYTLHLAASEPKLVGETFVDASFSNGALLRCRITTYGEFSGGCTDLNQTYRNYISEFLRRGTFDCQECEARVAEDAAAWQQKNARTLTGADTTTITHGAGSSVNVRVTAADGAKIECLLWGANPVTIEACK